MWQTVPSKTVSIVNNSVVLMLGSDTYAERGTAVLMYCTRALGEGARAHRDPAREDPVRSPEALQEEV